MAEVAEFRGARKITSLGVYPLAYHKNEEQVRKDLIERGKKFVSLAGVHYRGHQGMAYYKKKRSVVKVNINGRVMVDPSIHRRINPNYPISHVRPKDHDVLTDDEGDGDDDNVNDSDGGCGCVGSGSDAEDNGASGENGEKIKFVNKVVTDPKGNIRIIRVPKDSDDGDEQKLAQLDDKAKEEGADAAGQDADEKAKGKAEKATPEFSDEEYLIASPVVLGFSFAEKLWLEFTVSGIKDIQWNESAYDSLVLEPKTKDIVKVRRRRFFFPTPRCNPTHCLFAFTLPSAPFANRALPMAAFRRRSSSPTSTTPPRASTTSSSARARASWPCCTARQAPARR